MKTGIQSDEIPDLLKQQILKRKEDLSKAEEHIRDLQEELGKVERNETDNAIFEKAKKKRNEQMRRALAKACSIVGLQYNIPHRHSEICQLYVTLASQLKDMSQQYQKEQI